MSPMQSFMFLAVIPCALIGVLMWMLENFRIGVQTFAGTYGLVVLVAAWLALGNYIDEALR